jgi:hypothetical protein
MIGTLVQVWRILSCKPKHNSILQYSNGYYHGLRLCQCRPFPAIKQIGVVSKSDFDLEKLHWVPHVLNKMELQNSWGEEYWITLTSNIDVRAGTSAAIEYYLQETYHIISNIASIQT